MCPKSQTQFARWLDGSDESPWQSGFELRSTAPPHVQSFEPGLEDEMSPLVRLQTEMGPEQDISQELVMAEDNSPQVGRMESDRSVQSEVRTLETRTLRTDNEQPLELSGLELRHGSNAGENSATVDETEGGSLNNERDEGVSNIPPDDLSTEVPSSSSEKFHSQISSNDTESTKLDTKTRWAFLDEERRNDSDMNAEDASQGLENLALDMIRRPEVAPSIMEQISIISSQHLGSLTEEQYQNFLKHPRERQKQSLQVFLDNLAGLGPWFGARKRMSQEENLIGV